jgi:hypothetical protein
MSDEEKSAGDGTGTAAVSVPIEQPELDEHTTEPNAPVTAADTKVAPAGGNWQMPKPKFQQTSGYLPQGYLKDMNQAAAAAKSNQGSEDTTQEQPSFAATAGSTEAPSPAVPPAIEPQPDLSEQLIPEEPVVENTAPQARTSSGASFPLIALGIIGLLIFAVIFIVAVYFLYIRQPGAGGGVF